MPLPPITETERMARTMSKIRLPRPAAECLAILEKNGHQPGRCKWRVRNVKRHLGIISKRVRGGWIWTTKEIERTRLPKPLADSLHPLPPRRPNISA